MSQIEVGQPLFSPEVVVVLWEDGGGIGSRSVEDRGSIGGLGICVCEAKGKPMSCAFVQLRLKAVVFGANRVLGLEDLGVTEIGHACNIGNGGDVGRQMLSNRSGNSH